MPDKFAERNNRIMELRAQGLTFSEIAALVGVSRNAVAGTVDRRNKAPRKRRGAYLPRTPSPQWLRAWRRLEKRLEAWRRDGANDYATRGAIIADALREGVLCRRNIALACGVSRQRVTILAEKYGHRKLPRIGSAQWWAERRDAA